MNKNEKTNAAEPGILLKIGRHEYTITSADLFMDNGCCVQLLTQSKKKVTWGIKPSPVLSKKAIKEISGWPRVQKNHNYSSDVQAFCLDL